ncbi:hypothetical protein ACLOJK_009183 [Asimina triloba]
MDSQLTMSLAGKMISSWLMALNGDYYVYYCGGEKKKGRGDLGWEGERGKALASVESLFLPPSPSQIRRVSLLSRLPSLFPVS